MMSASLGSLLFLLVVSQPPKVLVMDVRLAPNASREARAAAPLLERALSTSMARHSGMEVTDRESVRAQLSAAMRQELLGCDSSSCMLEIANAMGVDLVMTSVLDERPGLWALEVSLVERRTAVVQRRQGLRVRSVDALLSSIDQLAREFGGPHSVTLGDPRLATRLATSKAGVDLLAARVRTTPDAPVSDAWTDVVVEHNRESLGLASLEAAAVIAGVAGFAVFSSVAAVTSVTLGVMRLAYGSTATVLVLPLYAATAGALLAAGAGLGTALVLVVVDALNLGRIKVGTQGCCRDEPRLRDAEEPRLADYALVALTALSAASVVGFPMAFITSLVVGAAWLLVAPASVPNLPDAPGWNGMNNSVGTALLRGPLAVLLVATGGVVLGTTAVALWLLLDSPSRLTGE